VHLDTTAQDEALRDAMDAAARALVGALVTSPAGVEILGTRQDGLWSTYH
jgi:hypothetical protein